MTEENNHERVAYLRRLAIDSLKNYRGGFAELEQLDRDLKSIIRSISDVTDSTWMKLLVRNWGQLEIIYASALNDGRLLLTQDEEADVRAIVTKLLEDLRDQDLPPSSEKDNGC